jgi:DNA invertase Pin-like site-specific DNA recombinase
VSRVPISRVPITLPRSENGSKLRPMIGAVIYVRVSTKEQTENLSLPTQLRACEEYCRREGYEVLERFKEEGESAKTTDRSELQKLLKYCRTHKGKVHFLIVYNLTRFAREKYDHFALRAHLKSLGISLRSATEPIDDTSTGKLMEGVLASFAQFDNDVRSERTRAGMRAALELGRWTFPAPARVSQRAEVVPQESHTGSRTRATREAGIRGLRHGTIHEAGSPGPRHRTRIAHAAWPGALTTKFWTNAAELDLHRHDRES